MNEPSVAHIETEGEDVFLVVDGVMVSLPRHQSNGRLAMARVMSRVTLDLDAAQLDDVMDFLHRKGLAECIQSHKTRLVVEMENLPTAIPLKTKEAGTRAARTRSGTSASVQ